MARFITLLGLALTLLVAPKAAAQVGEPVTIADANVIAEADLVRLPHIDAARAKALVGKRSFLSITALDMFLQNPGSNRMQLDELYGRLFLYVNLNTASDAEIQRIPNLGARMLREFKEYRPYAGLPVFHREIDKYVDDGELARFEQYLLVPIKSEHRIRRRHPDDSRPRAAHAARVQGIPSVQGDRSVPARDRQVRQQEVARLERYRHRELT